MAPPLGWWNVVGPYRLIEWRKTFDRFKRGLRRRWIGDPWRGGVVSGGGVALRVVSNSVREKLSGAKGVIGEDSMDVDGGATL
ncbi:hypothetical protein Tco_1049656 [Tanacetum coccineum]